MKNVRTQKQVRSKELEKPRSKVAKLEDLDAPAPGVKGGGQINDL